MFHEFITFVRELYDTSDYIPLHRPAFHGNEKKYLIEAIDSTEANNIKGIANDFGGRSYR